MNPNSISVAGDESGVLARYGDWKTAHGQSTSTMMSFYASDARIIQLPGSTIPPLGIAGLKVLCDDARRSKTFDSVSDQDSPQVRTEGARIVITAHHRYGHSGSGNAYAGDRRLIWEKRDGQWLIIEDDFSHSYTPVP
jgi:ketosteroid isomerase-like protein